MSLFRQPSFEVEELSGAELDPELFEALPLSAMVDRAVLLPQLALGNRDENKLTNFLFWRRHPALQGKKLVKGQEPLMREWIQIRDQVVRPVLQQAPSGTTATAAPTTIPTQLGTLVAELPGRRFTYPFTPDDVLWTARFMTGEAGGEDNEENRAVVWAMFNRYGFFRHRVPGWGSFGSFLRQYSTPLQPFLNSYGQVKAHVAKCNSNYDNPGCDYAPTSTAVYPGTAVRKGNLKRFVELQRRPWKELPAAARSLAVRLLTGKEPNRVGLASEFANTAIYFKRKRGRLPTQNEWEQFTRAHAKNKKWTWLEQAPYGQYKKNVLFINNSTLNYPPNTTRVLPPNTAPGIPPSPAPGIPPSPAGAALKGDPDRELLYDGSAPAKGTTDDRRSYPVQPPVTGASSRRTRLRYENVINQFAPHANPRYAHVKRNNRVATWCNIFLWDVTSAMGAEIPHWVDAQGNPVQRGQGKETTADGVCDWLRRHGPRFGWRKLSGGQEEAQRLANAGLPVVVALSKPGATGHVAVIRPGTVNDKGAEMAQAGAKNRTRIRFYEIFARNSAAELWAHD